MRNLRTILKFETIETTGKTCEKSKNRIEI